MKYWVGLLILCCLSLPSISLAKDCKIKENKEGYLATGNYKFGRSAATALNIGFLADNDGPLLQATYVRQFKSSEITVDAETPLTLQFEGGKKVVLEPIGEDRAKRTVTGFLFSTKKMYPTYAISNDDLNQIANENLVRATISVKLQGELTTGEYKTKKKWAERIKKIANCIIQAAGLPRNTLPVTRVKHSSSSSDQNSNEIDISGRYESKIIAESTKNYFKKGDVELTLIQDGNKVEGTFGSQRKGKIWGQIEGDIIEFDWVSSGGDNGLGKWIIDTESSELRGTWTSSSRNRFGKWNLKKIE